MGLARLAPQDAEDNSGGFAHPGRRRHRHAGFHGARAGEELQHGGLPRRPLQPRLHPVLPADGPACPLPGGGNIEKLLKHQMDAPRPVEEFRADVPEAARSVLLRMLVKRPEERVQTASKVAAALAPLCKAGGAFVAGASTNGGPASTGTLAMAPTVAPMTTPTGRMVGRLSRKLPVLPANYRQLARKHWRGLALAGVGVLLMGIGLIVVRGLFGTSANGKPRTTDSVASGKLPFTPRGPTSSKPPVSVENGHRYLPDDTGMVATLSLAQLFKSPVANDAVRDWLETNQILVGMKSVLGYVGIDLFRDVQRLMMASSPTEPVEKFCIVFYGSFNPEKFSIAAGRNAARSHEVKGMPKARIYEYNDTVTRRQTFFGLVDSTTLIFSSDKDHVVHCFRRAAGQPTPDLSDASVQTLLRNLDSRPTFFMVLGRTYLGKGSKGGRDGVPIQSMHGGLRFAEGVSAEAVVTANRPEAVDLLRGFVRHLVENQLKSLEFLAPLVPQWLSEGPKVNKQDMTLTFRHSFSADEFRRLVLQKKP